MPNFFNNYLLDGGLISLNWADLLIIIIYFLIVLGIGYYLVKYTKTGDDFFLAGRKMTMWIAGPGFYFCQPRFSRIDGLGCIRLSIWDFSSALVLDRCHSRYAFFGNYNDAVLLHFQNALGTGLFKIAFWQWLQHVISHFFWFYDGADEWGKYVCHGVGNESDTWLGFKLQYLGFFYYGNGLRNVGWFAFCHIQ